MYLRNLDLVHECLEPIARLAEGLARARRVVPVKKKRPL